MNNVLRTYVRQRIHPGLILGLGILIFLFSRPISQVNAGSLVTFAFLILFIFVFRLYDDLLQAAYDSGKPDRDYTEPESRKTLFFYLIIFTGILFGIGFVISGFAAFLLLIFMATNHLLYVLLISNRTAAGFLPLLKYPFVFVLLQFMGPSEAKIGLLVCSAFSLFLAFVAFESMDDETFPVAEKYSWILQALSLLMILAGKVNGISLAAFFLLLSSSAVWSFFRMKAYPYVYLLFFLAFKLIIDES